ncbi:TPA: LysR substrate-binding domain-containing protein [Streptococcus suis]
MLSARRNKNFGRVDNINIAASHTFSIYLLPDLIINLKQCFPNISFSIKMMNSLEVLNALEHHDIDFGFIEKPLSAKNIRRLPLFNDQLVLAGNPSIGPWLIREKTSGVYYYTQRYLEENDIQKETMTVQNNEIIIALLKKGFGCSIISQRAAKGQVYQKLSEKYSRQFYSITREQDASSELTSVTQWIQKKSDFQTSQQNL